MPKKGHTNNPKGRPKGVPNKVTTEIRTALKDLADNNLDKVQTWLDRIAEDDPKGAMGMYLTLLEYVQPKLSRTELAGDKDNPVSVIDMSKWK